MEPKNSIVNVMLDLKEGDVRQISVTVSPVRTDFVMPVVVSVMMVISISKVHALKHAISILAR